MTLVCGDVSAPLYNPFGAIRRIDALSAEAMHQACLAEWDHMNGAILCAAVADFTPATPAAEKIKKQPGQTEMHLELRTTPDIARALGESKHAGQKLIGFALETEHEKENALRKLERKKMDGIVLNSLRDAGAGFGTDTNRVTIINSDNKEAELPLLSKADVAAHIIDTFFT